MRGFSGRSPFWSRRGRILVLFALALLIGSCSPYVGLNVGVPFNVGNVTINPNIGIGFPL
jgi:hypothetical protein